MPQYYYTDGTERYGPFSVDELKSKEIRPDTLVWREGFANWTVAGKVVELQSLFGAEGMEGLSPLSSTTGVPLGYLQPKSWLLESILVTLICLPFGIVGIVHASKVDSFWKNGRHLEATHASLQALKWVRIAFVFGLVTLIPSLVGLFVRLIKYLF